MIKCPIDYFKDNLVFNQDKSCWAVFKLIGYDYDFLSTESKISLLYKNARFFSGIMSEAKILIIPVMQDMKQHFRNLKKQLNEEDPLYDSAIEQYDKTYDYLTKIVQDNGAVNDYSTYMIVKLQDSAELEVILRAKELYDFFVKDPMNALNVLMNTDTRDILEQRVEGFARLANKWLYKQNQRMRMQKADVLEIQWLFRRMAYRGVNKSLQLYYKDQNDTPWEPKAETMKIGKEKLIRPYHKDIVNLFSGVIRSRNRVLTVDTDRNKSYQTFLSITNMPDEFEYPDCEWIYMLQGLHDINAEICIHIKASNNKESLRKLELKRREFKSQLEHVENADDADIPSDLLEGKEYLDLMESELKTLKAPILSTSVTICLSARSKAELEKKVSQVRTVYEDMNFGIERSISDQLNLYMQFIPSVGQVVKDFVMPLTPVTLASGVIGASHQLGDGVGRYIGTTGIEEKPVFFDMGRACLQNKSASGIFLGNLGVGKSFNTNLLVYLTVISGGYALIFDPKGERSHWKDSLPVLDGLISTVTLTSAPEFKGRLDPYNVYEDLDMANELAINMLTELFEIKPTSNEYVAILEGVKRIQEGQGKPSMLKLADKLEHFDKEDKLYDQAAMLARRIRLQKEAGMAQLLIGDGTEEAISLDNRLNILQIQNLKLPSPETKKEDYSTEEKLSTVIMMVLSHFAKKFALVKRPVFKIVLFDEAWALGKTQEGVKLYDFLTRMGRSLFTGCIFNSHSVLDIPTEGIKNTLSYKFCFQTTNDNEASRMIQFLGLEDTPDLHDVLKNLGNGQCLFQDLDGHVGILQFDAVFQDIIDVFSTTPKPEEEKVQKLKPMQEKEELSDLEIDIYEREVV